MQFTFEPAACMKYQAQFYMIFDSAKRMVASGDAWPKEAQLKKGSYTLRVQVGEESNLPQWERCRPLRSCR